MKITDKQEKSKKYLAAVLALRDKKDELLKQQRDTLATIATIRAQLADIDTRMMMTVDAKEHKALRAERRELQETLVDNESIKLDVFGKVKALNSDLQPLRTAARDELDTFTDIANAAIEAIKEKARLDILNIHYEIDVQPFQRADRIIENIVAYGGWQNTCGGHVDETSERNYMPEESNKYSLDDIRADVALAQGERNSVKPETETKQWGAVARMMGGHPGK